MLKLGVEAAKAMGGKAGSEAFNFVLTSLGVKPDDMGDIVASLAKIQYQMAENKYLLKQFTEEGEAHTSQVELSKYSDSITAQFESLKMFTQYSNSTDDEQKDVNHKMDEFIKDTISQSTDGVTLWYSMERINTLLVGNNSLKGFYDIYFTMKIESQINSLENKNVSLVDDFFKLYKYWSDIQLTGYYIAAEAYHADMEKNPSTAYNTRLNYIEFTKKFKRNIKKQSEMFQNYLQAYCYIYAFELGDSSYQNDEFSIAKINNDSYSPTTIMQSADKLAYGYTLESASADDNALNKVVLRFVARNDSYIQDNDFGLLLINETLEKFAPDEVNDENSPIINSKYALVQINGNDYRIRKFNYSNLPDGKYHIDESFNPSRDGYYDLSGGHAQFSDGVSAATHYVGHPYLDHVIDLITTVVGDTADTSTKQLNGDFESITIIPFYGKFRQFDSSGYVVNGETIDPVGSGGRTHTYYFYQKETSAITVSYDIAKYYEELCTFDAASAETAYVSGGAFTQLASWETNNYGTHFMTINNDNSTLIYNFRISLPDKAICTNNSQGSSWRHPVSSIIPFKNTSITLYW